MKYFYGNSYKEALSNNPVEIESTEVQPSVIRCEKVERDEDGVRRYFDIDLKKGEII